jgi:hypothetical protein
MHAEPNTDLKQKGDSNGPEIRAKSSTIIDGIGDGDRGSLDTSRAGTGSVLR